MAIYIQISKPGSTLFPKNKNFNRKLHYENIWEVDDSRDAKVWSEEQVMFNNGKILTKSEAQAKVNDSVTASNSRDKSKFPGIEDTQTITL